MSVMEEQKNAKGTGQGGKQCWGNPGGGKI